MAVSSLKQVLDRLLETGLISDQQLRELGEKKNPDDTLPSIAGITRRLVDDGVLTPFQASQISDGRPELLVIDEYVLVDLLGSGGMGKVCLARHRIMQRDVAVKLLMPRSAEKIESIERFKREARAAAKLSHPNVVKALDAGVYKNQYYLVMDYVKGQSLSDIVRTQGAVRLDRALDLVIQAGQGIEYAHRKGVIHRDVKPSNLLLSDDGTVKVTDLGLSRVLQHDEEVNDATQDGDGLTSSGMIMGTVDFMAPEQAVTPSEADERADIYGLGCTLYYLATGESVFAGDTPMSRLIAHRENPVPKITDVLPNAPKSLNRVLKKMLAKEADNRYQTVGDALRDLRSCLREFQDGISEMSDTEYMPSGPVTPARKSVSRTTIILILVATAAVGAGASFLRWIVHSDVADETLTEKAEPGTESPHVSAAINPVVHEVKADSPPLNILEFIDLKNVRLNGDGWRFENGHEQLVMGSADRSRLSVPVTVPDSYWLSLEVRRLPSNDFRKGPFVIGLKIGSSHGFAAIDAHRETGARISFLGARKDSGQNLTTSNDFRINEEDFVTIQVEVNVSKPDSASVRAFLDDLYPLEWQGSPKDIDITPGWSTDWPEPVFIASNLSTQYEIRNFRIGAGLLPSEEAAEPE